MFIHEIQIVQFKLSNASYRIIDTRPKKKENRYLYITHACIYPIKSDMCVAANHQNNRIGSIYPALSMH